MSRCAQSDCKSTRIDALPQAKLSAYFTAVNILPTCSSHGASSVRPASLPISEKLAASARCWYLLSSWSTPAPGGPRPCGRRACRPPKRRLAGHRPHVRRRGSNAHPSDPRFRVNDAAIPDSREYTWLHTRATFPGQAMDGSFRWQATDPPSRVPPSPCSRPRPPPGPRPFNDSLRLRAVGREVCRMIPR